VLLDRVFLPQGLSLAVRTWGNTSSAMHQGCCARAGYGDTKPQASIAHLAVSLTSFDTALQTISTMVEARIRQQWPLEFQTMASFEI
jgi:hypothetical protein